MARPTSQASQSAGEKSPPAILPLNSGDVSVVVGGYSCAGDKGRNDDAFTVHVPQREFDRRLKGVVACIADGISSSQKSHIASQTAVVQFAQDYFSTPETWTVRDSGAKVLDGINRWLFAHSDNLERHKNGLVTTFSGLIVRSHTAHIFHAGDTRIYLFRRGVIDQLTRDHRRSVAFDGDLLTSALGLDSQLRLDYSEEDLLPGDLFLLLTDGIHGHVGSEDISTFLEKRELTSQEALEKTSSELCQLAKANGSNDDLSCLLVHIDDLSVEGIDEAHARLARRAIPPALDVGQKLDDLTVERVLHSGTRSMVYLVRRDRDDQRCVLKAPSRNFQDDLIYLEGFHREQWVGRHFKDPGLLQIYPAPDNSKFLYYLSEYITGSTLRQWISDNSKPSLNAVRDVVSQIVRVTRLLHRNGIVHRDLKPENVMLSEAGGLKIIDFGTVLISGLEDISQGSDRDPPQGSVDYIAPETLLGQRATGQSDLFSIGCMAYEMLTGRPPYRLDPSGRRWPKSYAGWSYTPARYLREDIPEWVDAALEKCLEPDPRNRYRAMSEFEEDLKRPGRYAREKASHIALQTRNPLLFWKMVSLILALVIVGQWLSMQQF